MAGKANPEFIIKPSGMSMAYEIMEELGEFPYIAYAKLTKNSNQPEWMYLPHYRFDGIGGMYYVLSANGYTFSELDLAKLEQHWEPVSFFTKLKASLALAREDLAEKKNETDYIHWKNFDITKRTHGKSCYIAWFVFSEKETKDILLSAKKHNSFLNSFLLWTLNTTINKTLINEAISNNWAVPVNMRGTVKNGLVSDNFANIKLTIRPDDSTSNIQDQLVTAISKQQHWANLWLTNITRILGKGFMRRMMKKHLLDITKNSQVGMFSYLGATNIAEANEREEIWFGCAPVFSFAPVSTASSIWNGRLTLTLTLHPVLTDNPSVIQNCLDEWKSLILSMI